MGPFRDAALTGLKRRGPKTLWSLEGGHTLPRKEWGKGGPEEPEQLAEHLPEWLKFFCTGRWSSFSKRTVSGRPHRNGEGSRGAFPGHAIGGNTG